MDTHIWLVQIGFILSFVLIWLGVTYLLSYLSGWVFVAEHYRAAQPFAGRYQRIRSSQMGPLGPLGGARNALNVGVDEQGLHLRMFVLFRLNCRDLFIPWTDITVTRGRAYFQEYVDFQFSKTPKIRVRIYGKAGEVIQAMAGPAWPAESAPAAA